MKKEKLFYLQLLTTFICLFVFLSFAVVITLNFRSLYYSSIEKYHIAEQTGLSEEIIRKNYDVLIDYNQIFGTRELKFPDFSMSEKGKIHFEEVKHIFVNIQILGVSLFVVLLFIVLYLLRKSQIHFLKWNFFAGISIPIVLGLFIGFYWEKAFVLFHKLFFNNDFWIFDPRLDPIITILPDEFFFVCAGMILFLFLAESCLSGILYRILKNRKKAEK